MSKRMKIFSIVIFFMVVMILGYVIYSNATKNDGKTLEDKVKSEIEYLEVKLLNMANRLNNITIQNYKVTTKEVEEQSESGDSSSNSAESGQDDQSQGNGGSNSSEGNQQGSGATTGGKSDNKEYNMERIKELSKDRDKDINWDDIQKEVEEIYTVIATITLDLYQTNINQEDILQFNGNIDDLADVVKNEDEEQTLNKLCELYSGISKFTSAAVQDELYDTVIKTKENVLKAYSKINTENWDEVLSNMQGAIDTFSVLLTNTNVDYGKQVNINKTYVILNEMKSVANKKNSDVFLIKYKNLLEEIGSM